MSDSLLDAVAATGSGVASPPSPEREAREHTEDLDPGRRGHRVAAFFLRRPGLVLAGLVIVVALLAAVFPTLLADQDPLRGVPARRPDRAQ